MVTEASALVAWYLCLCGMTFKVMVKVFICVASEELSGKLFCMWISELQKRGDIEDNYVAPQPPPPNIHTQPPRELREDILVSVWILSASASHFLYLRYHLNQCGEFHQTCIYISLGQAKELIRF